MPRNLHTKIHPRTEKEVKRGTPVLARTATGSFWEFVAVSGVIRDASGWVVRVTRPEEWAAAKAESREPHAVSWSAQSVFLPGDEPA